MARNPFWQRGQDCGGKAKAILQEIAEDFARSHAAARNYARGAAGQAVDLGHLLSRKE